MKLFDSGAALPTYYAKHKKVHDLLVAILVLIVSPIISILMFATNGANLVSTSISKLGWQNDMLAIVYIWGLLNLSLICYVLKLTLDSGSYSKFSKIMLYSVFGLGCAILLVGLSIPFITDEVPQHMLMRKMHNAFATVGFVMFVLLLIALTVMTLFRNKKQALISLCAMAFLIITGLFAVLEVNSPEKATFITAAAQLYIFAMLEVLLALQYFLNQVFKIDRIDKTSTGEIA